MVNKCKKIEIMWSNLYNYNGVKLEIIYKKKQKHKQKEIK